MNFRSIQKYITLLIPCLAAFLMYKFIRVPSEMEWKLGIFLCLIAIIERLYMQAFNKIWLPYFIIILGLVIFGDYSMFYSLFYLVPDSLYIWLKRRVNIFFDLLPSTSISLISVILGNEFYNHTNQGYIDRLLTLILLFILNGVLAHIFSFLESGKMTTAPFFNTFVPTWFEILFIFPLLASYSYFNYPVVLSSFFFYLVIVKLCTTRRLSVDEEHIKTLIRRIELKDGIDIYFMDLGEIKGIYYPNKKIIAIDDKLDYPEQFQTLIHEWIHLRIRGKFQFHSKFTAEIFVIFFEAIISWYFFFNLSKISVLEELQ